MTGIAISAVDSAYAEVRAYPRPIALIGLGRLLMSSGLTATGLSVVDPALLDAYGWARGGMRGTPGWPRARLRQSQVDGRNTIERNLTEPCARNDGDAQWHPTPTNLETRMNARREPVIANVE